MAVVAAITPGMTRVDDADLVADQLDELVEDVLECKDGDALSQLAPIYEVRSCRWGGGVKWLLG